MNRATLATLVLGLCLSTSPLLGGIGPIPFDHSRTALLITDPQNDFLSETGAAYGLFAANMDRLGTIGNIGKLFDGAERGHVPIFVSPHFYFPHDDQWQHRGVLQQQIHDIGLFRRSDALGVEGFAGSGADILERYKPVLARAGATIVSPHKVYGPDSNDLVLQLRMRGIDTVVLGGLAANLCTDSHLRELVEQGFRVVMVSDAVGAPGEEAYEAAIVNYGLIADAVWTTEEAVAWLRN
ncbi:MAG: isochorismatase family cysteine hydrolase [Candidatus Eisenbacteria bacterium]